VVPLSTLFTGSITPNLLMVTSVHWPLIAIAAAQGVLAAGVAVLLVTRWVAATGPARQVLMPVYGVALLGGATSLLDAVLTEHDHPLHLMLTHLGDAAIVLLPLAFLAGVWRMRRSRVTDLLVRLPGSSPAQLRDLLAEALADPSLRVAYIRASDGAHLDRDGRPVLALPGHAVTTVSRDERPVAALLHDPALHSNPHVLAAVASAAAMELDNQRLAAELQARLLEVQASRARIVAAGDEQRRRVQRDLHDGAQQHLVACALTLRMARDELGDQADPAVVALLGRTADLLGTAQSSLRELARGIHPALLADAGLAAALRALADRVPFPVALDVDPLPALPIEVETTAYFVAAEAVTNALRHARTTSVRIAVGVAEGVLRLRVADDGVGGADPSRGTGLAGLGDRVSAVDGVLSVVSLPGQGTAVCAELPVRPR
jgi:signal transduction histidine kinase